MAEIANAADITEKQADTDFAAGFETEIPSTVTPEMRTEVPAKVEPKPEPKPQPKVETKVAPKTEPKPKPAAPEYVQITKADLDELKAAASKTTAMETQLSKAFGSVGDLKETVRKLQAATPAGHAVEMPKLVLAKVRKDFPELAGLIEEDLAESLKGLRGTGTATEKSADPAAVQKLVTAAAIANEREVLEDAYPNWMDITGAAETPEKADPNHPFRKWLATRDAAYQQKVNSTNSSAVIVRAIEKFKAATAAPARVQPKPAPKVAARVDRIRSAIQPKGDGGQPAPLKTTDDFSAGFQQEYRSRVG